MTNFQRLATAATVFLVGSSAVVVGTSVPAAAAPTGGTITYLTAWPNGQAAIHVFTTDGTFTVPAGAQVSVGYVIVGGGGGGGNHLAGPLQAAAGGGGGGGFVQHINVVLGPGTYPVTVGAGGAPGVNGGDSTFDGVTAIGGGHVRSSVNSTADAPGVGGSGGGARCGFSGASGTPAQGKPGESAAACGADGTGFGGGGGGGATGQTFSTLGVHQRGSGSSGQPTNISGSSLFYSAGGGGGAYAGSTLKGFGGNAPVGGDGATNTVPATDGLDGRGGGGGGANVTQPTGGSGGSGVVIVRYQYKTLTYSGTTATSGTAPTVVDHLASGELTAVAGAGSLAWTGHVFTGWNLKLDGTGATYNPGDSIGITTNTTLYAQWRVQAYTIAFDPNHGSGATAPIATTYGQTNTLTTNTFTRTGYQFTGWNTAADGTGTAYGDAASVTDLTTVDGSTVTLFAQWKPIGYTVAFNADHGAGTMAPLAMTYDQSHALTTNTFKRTGYHFVGWNTAADGSGTSYADRRVVNNLSTVNGATITLYAQWKQTPPPAGSGTAHHGDQTTATTSPSGVLPNTGGPSIDILAVALGLIACGSLLVRRRRNRT